jgi:hypothetical protein
MSDFWSLLSPATVVPALPVQQVFHAAGWLALLSWCTVGFLPVEDKRWRWLVSSVFWLLFMGCWSWPLSALGMAFQTPSLLTLCLCMANAWKSIHNASPRLFYTARAVTVSAWLWLLLAILGWLLFLDTLGWLSLNLYAAGFDHLLPWLGWLCALAWLFLAYWFDLPAWHRQAAGCWLLATGLFVFTKAPSGNMWDAWLDPWLWLWANAKLIGIWWRYRARSNHS